MKLGIYIKAALPALLFLGLLPKDERKHDRQPQPTVFMYNIIRYLFLPLIGGYLVVLYVYASTIIARWELPNGWVSNAIGINLAVNAGPLSPCASNRVCRTAPLARLPCVRMSL